MNGVRVRSVAPSSTVVPSAGTTAEEGPWALRSRTASEVVLIFMACLAPWAFGAVEAWAQFLLVVGIVLLALLRVPRQWGRSERPALLCTSSLALAGLVALALFQGARYPTGVLGWLAPGQARLRGELVPPVPERVAGDAAAAVPLPRTSISANPELTLQAAVGIACAWILFQSVMSLGPGFAPYRRFAVALVANGTVLALFSIIQRLSWNGKIYWLRAAPSGTAGPFVDHNHLAAYLNLALGLALGFLWGPARAGSAPDRGMNGGRLWASYAAGLIAVGVLVSLSRSGFLGMLAVLVGAAFGLGVDRRRLAAGLGIVLVLVALFFAALGGTEPYQKRLETLLGRAPYANRLRVWTGALRAWPHSPVFGAGLGTFATASARFYPFDAGETYMHAENEYVEWLVEGGVVGLGLVLAATVAVVGPARRACRTASAPGRRALLVGGLIGLLGLAVHSGGDFALRIPGVAVAVIVLGAHLTRLGLPVKRAELEPGKAPAAVALGRIPVPACLVAIASLGLIVPAFALARAEALSGQAGMPLAQSLSQTMFSEDTEDGWDAERLDEARTGLELALRDRPDWAEGHVALGLVLMRLYEQSARQALAREVEDPVLRARFARPLWLSLRVRTAPPDEPLTAETLLALDPVRDYLAPAARCFLEARRCDVLRPLPHTKLATLSFLLEGGDPGPVYLARALRVAGGSGLDIRRVGEVALVWGQLDLAADCWRNELTLRSRSWMAIAQISAGFLSPDEILRQVVPDGPHAVRFAQYLYADPGHETARRAFAAEALRRLEHDRTLPAAERLALCAEAYALLDDRPKARLQMMAALALRPERARWRRTLVEWLVAWHRLDEAYGQARVGATLAPQDEDARQALDLAADALARAGDATRGERSDDADQAVHAEAP